VSAGLPGLGLGGLFFVLLALLAPFVELVRTTRGRSSVTAWRAVGREFALALTMIAAVALTLRLLYALADAAGLAGPHSDRSPTVLALGPIGIMLGLLACVLAAAKAMQLIATIRTRRRRPLPALRALCCRPRSIGQLSALTAIFSTLLVALPELAHAPAGGKAAATDRPAAACANAQRTERDRGGRRARIGLPRHHWSAFSARAVAGSMPVGPGGYSIRRWFKGRPGTPPLFWAREIGLWPKSPGNPWNSW
jgi:hypothetical protein